MASIARALARIKDDVRSLVSDEWIRDGCRAAGHCWRERRLGPVETLFVLQVIHFNTAIRHIRHLAGHAVNAAAYCEARMRLPLGVLRSLLRDSAAAAARSGAAAGCWCGLRVLRVDGSSTIAPDTPASGRAFGQPSNQKPGCGFPVPQILALFDAFSGMALEALCLPLFTHEQSRRLHPMLRTGDLLVGDRSYVHLAMLHLRGVWALFRMHQRQIVDFRPRRKPHRKGQRGRPRSRVLRRLGKHDQLVAWARPKAKPQWMTEAQWKSLPAELQVRELRYHVTGRGRRTRIVTIATTLLDPIRYGCAGRSKRTLPN